MHVDLNIALIVLYLVASRKQQPRNNALMTTEHSSICCRRDFRLLRRSEKFHVASVLPRLVLTTEERVT